MFKNEFLKDNFYQISPLKIDAVLIDVGQKKIRSKFCNYYLHRVIVAGKRGKFTIKQLNNFNFWFVNFDGDAV